MPWSTWRNVMKSIPTGCSIFISILHWITCGPAQVFKAYYNGLGCRTFDDRHRRCLLQTPVLGFGFSQDGDVRIGLFPEGEEVLIGRLGLGAVMLHGISAS